MPGVGLPLWTSHTAWVDALRRGKEAKKPHPFGQQGFCCYKRFKVRGEAGEGWLHSLSLSKYSSVLCCSFIHLGPQPSTLPFWGSQASPGGRGNSCFAHAFTGSNIIIKVPRGGGSATWDISSSFNHLAKYLWWYPLNCWCQRDEMLGLRRMSSWHSKYRGVWCKTPFVQNLQIGNTVSKYCCHKKVTAFEDSI